MYSDAATYRCSKCLESIAFSVLDGADSAENLVEMEDVKENIFSLCPINRSHVSICLLGPSGAGKTYIINFMLGMWNDMLVRSAPKYATDFMEMLDWDVSKVHAKASKKDFLENQACSLEGYIDFMLTRKCFVVATIYVKHLFYVSYLQLNDRRCFQCRSNSMFPKRQRRQSHRYVEASISSH